MNDVQGNTNIVVDWVYSGVCCVKAVQRKRRTDCRRMLKLFKKQKSVGENQCSSKIGKKMI